MYYIYHIPLYVHSNGIIGKIGTSHQPAKRVASQGFTEYTILEEHSCIYEASYRERELQFEYGYPVDSIPYWQVIQMATMESRSAGGKAGGKIQGCKNVESSHLASIRSKEASSAGGKVSGNNHVKSGHIYTIATYEGRSNAGKKASITNIKSGQVHKALAAAHAIKVTCVHCGITCTKANHNRWHGNKCKHKSIA